jgi:hypothetical protein
MTPAVTPIAVRIVEFEGTSAAPVDVEFQRHKIVIAAAVAAVCGEGAVIRGIRRVTGPGSWTRHGRQNMQRTHDPDDPLARSMPDRGGRRK